MPKPSGCDRLFPLAKKKKRLLTADLRDCWRLSARVKKEEKLQNQLRLSAEAIFATRSVPTRKIQRSRDLRSQFGQACNVEVGGLGVLGGLVCKQFSWSHWELRGSSRLRSAPEGGDSPPTCTPPVHLLYCHSRAAVRLIEGRATQTEAVKLWHLPSASTALNGMSDFVPFEFKLLYPKGKFSSLICFPHCGATWVFSG